MIEKKSFVKIFFLLISHCTVKREMAMMLRYYHDLEKKMHAKPEDSPSPLTPSVDLVEIETRPGHFMKRLSTVKHVWTSSTAPRSEISKVRISAASPEWIRQVSVREIINNIPARKAPQQ